MKGRILTVVLIFSGLWTSVLPDTPVRKHPKTEKGEQAYAQGKYNEAMDYFHEAIEAGDPRGEPYYYIGSILELRRNYDEALSYYEEANKRPLEEDFKKAVLWKLILLHRAKKNYTQMLDYIDEMEENGVTHPNFDKFRQEAEQYMSPEKVEARRLIKEAETEIKTWEEANPGKEFWKADNSKAHDVLYKYKRALWLDPGLLSYRWKVAGYLEKMGLWMKAYEAYRDISSVDQRGIVYYKMGVMLKRMERYEEAISTLEQSLERENAASSLMYYIYLNQSQSYFPLGEYQKGAEVAQKAASIEKTAFKGSMSFSNYMICLNRLFLPEETGPKQCQKVIDSEVFKKAKLWQKGMLFYLRAAYAIETGENFQQQIDSDLTEALIPPEYRNYGKSEFQRQNDYKVEDSQDWNAIPDWLRSAAPHAFEYWVSRENWNKAYLLTLLYPSRFGSDSLPSMFVVVFHLELYEKAVEIAKKIKPDTLEMQKMYLLALLETRRWDDFQSECISYASASPEAKEELALWLVEIKALQKIPMMKQKPNFIQRFFQKPPQNEKEEIEPENTDNPESSTEPSTEDVLENSDDAEE